MGVDRLCLDTSAYSHFRRGHDTVVELVDGARWIGVPAIVLGELRAGFALGERRDWNEERLTSFLSNPSVEVLVVDGEVSQHYADIVRELRTSGTPRPTNDVWIAATAAASGSIVLTYDRDFESIARVGSVVLRAE